jgi:hypothetical protein
LNEKVGEKSAKLAEEGERSSPEGEKEGKENTRGTNNKEEDEFVALRKRFEALKSKKS